MINVADLKGMLEDYGDHLPVRVVVYGNVTEERTFDDFDVDTASLGDVGPVVFLECDAS